MKKNQENEDNENKVKVEENEITLTYDSEFEREKDQYQELEEVFRNFALKEASQYSRQTISEEAAAGVEDDKSKDKQVESTVYSLLLLLMLLGRGYKFQF